MTGAAVGSGAATREPQQDRSRATRARLVAAALACLAEQGWTASTVAVVAGRAGVSRGAAQHHFPTREALFTAALSHVMAERREQLRRELVEVRRGTAADTQALVEVIFACFTGPMFRAALALWTAAAAEPQLREQIVPLEARVGRELHQLVVELLGVDESVPGVRESVQATLDLGRGLGLADLLTDDSRRRSRIAAQWARMLDQTLPRGAGSGLGLGRGLG